MLLFSCDVVCSDGGILLSVCTSLIVAGKVHLCVFVLGIPLFVATNKSLSLQGSM